MCIFNIHTDCGLALSRKRANQICQYVPNDQLIVDSVQMREASEDERFSQNGWRGIEAGGKLTLGDQAELVLGRNDSDQALFTAEVDLPRRV